MKESYKHLDMSVIEFESEDIIVTSVIQETESDEVAPVVVG